MFGCDMLKFRIWDLDVFVFVWVGFRKYDVFSELLIEDVFILS